MKMYKQLLKDTRKTISWHYPSVVRTGKVLRLLGMLFAGFCIVCFVVLVLVNPCWVPVVKWNTIDHVKDRRFLHDYTKNETVAFSQQKSWLALATDKGATLFNTRSRIPREQKIGGGCVDVCNSFLSNEFVFIGKDQGVYRIRPGFPGGVKVDTFIKPPVSAGWSFSGILHDEDIMGNVLDSAGWTMAVPGKGIVRYSVISEMGKRRVRTRNWQCTSLSNYPLSTAQFTAEGIWVIGVTGGINYLDRKVFTEDKQRAVRTSPIAFFDAPYGDKWAAAIDTLQSLWLFSGNEEHWQGPYFGGGGQVCKLNSLDDVTTVCKVGHRSFWGTPYGLFYYDTNKRIIRCCMPGMNARHLYFIDTLRNNKDYTALIVYNNTEIKYLPISRNPKTDLPRAMSIDKGAFSHPFLSDDGLFVYRRTLSLDGNKQTAVRMLSCNSLEPSAKTIIEDSYWKAQKYPPEIIDVEKLSTDEMLFTTASGAFIYNVNLQKYLDCSHSQFSNYIDKKVVDKKKRLLSFGMIDEENGNIVTIADKNPQIFNRSKAAWSSLDPQYFTNPIELVNSAENIIGLDKSGVLYYYDQTIPWTHPKSYFNGSDSEVFSSTSNGIVEGDLIKDSFSWKCATLGETHVALYTSNNGKITRKPFPKGVNRLNTRQVRFEGNDLLFLRTDGSIISDKGAFVFGKSALPVLPEMITYASLYGNYSNEVIVGSGTALFLYSPQKGSWEQIGITPINSVYPVTAVVHTGDGFIAETADEKAYFLEDVKISGRQERNWIELPFTNVAVNSDNYKLWAKKNSQIVCTNNRYSLPSKWEYTHYSNGSGMKQFVQSANCVWTPFNHTAIFMRNDGTAGIFRTATDSWVEKTSKYTPSEGSFANGNKYIYFLKGERIDVVDTSLHAVRTLKLPQGIVSSGIACEENIVYVSGRKGLQTQLLQWNTNKLTYAPEKFTRGGGAIPAQFNTRQCIWARALGSHDNLLLDSNGNCVTYNDAAGIWDKVLMQRDNSICLGMLSGKKMKSYRYVYVTRSNEGKTDINIIKDNVTVTTVRLPFEKPFSTETKPEIVRITSANNEVLYTGESISVERKDDKTKYLLNPHCNLKGFKTDDIVFIRFSTDSTELFCLDKNSGVARYTLKTQVWQLVAAGNRKRHLLYAEKKGAADSITVVYKDENKKLKGLLIKNDGQVFEKPDDWCNERLANGTPDDFLKDQDGVLCSLKDAIWIRQNGKTLLQIQYPEYEGFLIDQVIKVIEKKRELLLVDDYGGVAACDKINQRIRVVTPGAMHLRCYGLLIDNNAAVTGVVTEIRGGKQTGIVSLIDGTVAKYEFSNILPDHLAMILNMDFIPDSKMTVGELYRNENILLYRKDGVTEFYRKIDQDWHLQPVRNTTLFYDQINNFTPTTFGGIAATYGDTVVFFEKGVEHGTLVPVKIIRFPDFNIRKIVCLPTGTIKITSTTGNSQYWKRENAESEPSFTSYREEYCYSGCLLLGDKNINWFYNSAGTVFGKWESGTHPEQIWAESFGKLKHQHVIDQALIRGDVLLQLTEAGLVTRRSQDYTLEQVDRTINGNALIVTEAEWGKVIVRKDGKNKFIWQDGITRSCKAEEQNYSVASFNAGSSEWLLENPGTGKTKVRILHRGTDKPKKWIKGRGGWCFKEDVVNWIGRKVTGDSPLLLATFSGIWSLENGKRVEHEIQGTQEAETYSVTWQESGRNWIWRDRENNWITVSENPQSVSRKTGEVAVGNAVLTVSLLEGKLRFRSFDEKPPFIDGRMFTDNAGKIYCSGGKLFTIVSGRCILQRDVENPGTIEKYWVLPKSAQHQRGLNLRLADSLIILFSSAAESNKSQVWEFDTSKLSDGWKRSEVSFEKEKIWQNIVWKRQSSGKKTYQPFLQTQKGLQSIPGWWHDDRFSWDHSESMGVVDSVTMLIMTPAGLNRKRIKQGDVMFSELLPEYRGTSILCGNLGRKKNGLILKQRDSNSPHYFVWTKNKKLFIDSIPVIADLVQTEIHRIAFYNDGITKHFGVVDSFCSLVSDENIKIKPVSIDQQIPLLREELLIDGQFAFDRAIIASRANTVKNGITQKEEWFTVSALSNESSALLSRNRLSVSESGIVSVFELDNIARLPFIPSYLRHTGGDTLWALEKKGANWILRTSCSGRSRENWEIVPKEKCKELFRTGDFVRFNVAENNWLNYPRYIWNSDTASFEHKPSAIPLFVSVHDSVRIGLDVFSSVISDTILDKIAIGTQGGVLVNRTSLTLSGNRGVDSQLWRHLFIKEGVAFCQSQSVTSLHCCPDSSWWIESDAKSYKYKPAGGVWQTSDSFNPLKKMDTPYGELVINKTSFMLNGKEFDHSNDAWLIGRRPFNSILGALYDGYNNCGWLFSRKNGIYKIYLKTL